MVRVEPDELGGSDWLVAHGIITLGIQAKLCILVNQRCHFQLDLALLLVKSLSEGKFLGLLGSTKGVATTSLETTGGVNPSLDFEAIVGLDFLPFVSFVRRVKRKAATHLE